ncbi:MAG: hypothetical protein Q9168_003652 [Polycauliona sp. 1 TL-2023]
MPSTRAALRSHAPIEDPNAAATMPLSNTPSTSKRAPLGEITGNQEEVPQIVADPEAILKANKNIGNGKKSKASKKTKKDVPKPDSEASGKVLPDENESDTSCAVENACQDLLNDQSQDGSALIVHEDRPSTPPSPAVAAATSALQDSAIPIPVDNEVVDPDTNEAQEQIISTQEQLNPTRSSDQMTQEVQTMNEGAGKQGNEDAIPEKNNTLMRVSMRSEDSIEAMDKFEEEMEKVGDLLPVVKKHDQSPKEKTRNAATSATKDFTGNKGPASTQAQAQNEPPSKKRNSVVNPKMAVRVKKGLAVASTTLPKSESTSTDPKTRKVSDSSSTSETSTLTVAKKRVSSVHKAPFVPSKSSKPPTRASFELPGESVARRLKEAREERMKREEEQKDVPRKTSFKARPVRLSQAPIVKPTATSRARISMAKGETPAAVSTTKNLTSNPTLSSGVGTASNGIAGKRLSTLSVNKRSAPTSANTSARLNRGPSTTTPSGPQITKSRPSMAPSVRQSVTAADAAQMKAKGKSIFNRGRIEHDELEQMKKDKEEAAKKARADAAERGRIASKKWAEKQKAKKVAAKKGIADAAVGGETAGSA